MLKCWFNCIKVTYIIELIFLITIFLLAIFSTPYILMYYILFSIGIIGINTVVHFVSFIRNYRKDVIIQKVSIYQKVVSNYMFYILMQGIILTIAIELSKLIGVLDVVRIWLKVAFSIFLMIYVSLTSLALVIFRYKKECR